MLNVMERISLELTPPIGDQVLNQKRFSNVSTHLHVWEIMETTLSNLTNARQDMLVISVSNASKLTIHSTRELETINVPSVLVRL